MRGRGIELPKEDLVLISIGLKTEASRGNDDQIEVEDLPDLLGINRALLLRYISTLSRNGEIKKMGRVPFRISLSMKGWDRYLEITTRLKGITLDEKRYCLGKPVKLGYFIKYIGNYRTLIIFLRELQKRNGFDILKFIKIESDLQEESKFMSILKEMRDHEDAVKIDGVDLASLRSEHLIGPTIVSGYNPEIEKKILEGEILRRQGKLKRSLDLFSKILDGMKETNGAEWILAEVGRIQTLRYMNSLKLAKEEIEKDLKKVQDNNQKGLLKRLKADILSDQGSFEDARDQYRSAVGHFQFSGSDNLLSICYNNMAVMFFRMKMATEAEYFWRKTLKISQRTNIPWARALVLTNLSDLNARNGRFRKAKKMLNEAKKIFISLGDLEGCSGVDFNMSLVFIFEDNRESALRFFDKAMRFPLRYDMKRKERWIVLKDRFEEKGWQLPPHLKKPP